MSGGMTIGDLEASANAVEELFADVLASEGTLSAGTKVGVGTQAVQALRETRVSFGNPSDNLVRLSDTLLNSVGAELTEVRRLQLASNFAFYYLTLTVSLLSPGNAPFSRLECSLDLGPKGPDEPIVQSVFPTAQWSEVLRVGAHMRLALDGDLRWQVGLGGVEVAAMSLPNEIRAAVTTDNSVGGFVVVPDYTFALGRADIAATGEGSSYCLWRIAKPELRQVQTVQFGVVLKLQPHVTSLDLTALCAATPRHTWLVGALRWVWSELSERVKQLIGRDDDDVQLVIGDSERWHLDLPA